MQWFAVIRISDDDRTTLQEYLPGERYRLEQRNDETYLHYLQDINHSYEESRQVYEWFRQHLLMLTGAMRLQKDHFNTLNIDRVGYLSPDGLSHEFIYVQEIGIGTDSVELSIDGVKVKELNWAELALSLQSETVERVLRFLGSELNAYNLWKVFELIRGEEQPQQPQKLSAKELLEFPKEEIRILKASLNSPEGLGDENARHAHVSFELTKEDQERLLSLTDSASFIIAITRKWLGKISS